MPGLRITKNSGYFKENHTFIFLVVFCILSPLTIAGSHLALTLVTLSWSYNIFSGKKDYYGRNPVDLPLIVFAGIAVLSVLFSIDAKFSIRGLKGLLLILLYFVTANSVKSVKQVKTLLTALVASSAAASCYGIYQFFSRNDLLGSNVFLHGKLLPRASGLSATPMTYGEYMSMVLVVSAGLLMFYLTHEKGRKYSNRVFFLIASALAGSALYFSFTRAALIGGTAGVLLLLFLKNRKYFIAGVLVVTLTAGIVLGVFPDGNMSVRIKDMLNPQGRTIPARLLVWKSSINMFKDRPLTGVGWECYRKAYPAYMIKKEGVHWVNFRKRVFSHAHSNFLNIAAETGIFGLAAFLWVLISIVISSANIYRNTRDKMLKTTALSCLAVFLVFFISGVTEYNFGDSEVAMLFYFLLGITFAIPRIETIL